MNNCNKILIVENLTKKFGGLTAIDNANLYVNKGEIIGMIGANGAGKTTLFNMISGAFQPTSGTILFHDMNITHLKSHQVCKMGIARTYQIVQPFENLTVLENTMVGSFIHTGDVNAAKVKAMDVLQFLGLSNRAHAKGSDLTLSELKRLEMAKALATNPEIILLDEVMAGLNPTSCGTVVELIKKIRDSGTTVLVIEHVMKAIMSLSDRIYVLNQGRIIAEGVPQDVVNRPEVIKSYLGEKAYAKGI